jgi:hypothetical protein
VVKIFGPREEVITLFNRKVYNEELHKAYTYAVLSSNIKLTLEPAMRAQRGRRDMALLFLQPWC